MSVQKVRRKLLKAFGVSGAAAVVSTVDPLAMIFKSVTHGIIAKANAQVLGQDFRRYVNFFQGGGAPKWTFDLWLTPFDRNAYVHNPYIGTRYRELNGRYVDVEYATWQHNGIHLPWLWQFDIPRAGGGMRPMTDLMQNMMIMQGVDVLNSTHSAAQTLHYLPIGLAQSIGSLVGDLSATPIPVVNAGAAGFKYSGFTGVAAAPLSGSGNYIDKILDPFKEKGNGNLLAQKALVQAEYDNAIGALNAFANSRHPAADGVAKSLDSAHDMIAIAARDFSQEWNQLHNKYQDLMFRAGDPSFTMAGINDRPIGTTGTRDGKYHNDNDQAVSNADLRTILTSRSQVGGLVNSFAIAEFLIKNDISDYVACGISGRGGLSIQGARGDVPYDEHGCGSMVSLIVNSFSNRAIASAMAEFIDQMKAANKFNDLVIDLSSEFGRNPRNDGTGSDHGNNCTSYSFWSGAISGPVCVGDLIADAQGGAYTGSWGAAAPMANIGNRTLNLNHYAATVATMLKRPNPAPSAPSIVRESNGQIIADILNPTRQV